MSEGLDKEVVDEAVNAFETLDEWSTAVSSGGNPEPTVVETKTEEVDAALLPSREEARKSVVYDREDFSDVVTGGQVDMEKLAEYCSEIEFSYRSVDGKSKVGRMPKYPGFLALMGASSASEISAYSVAVKFIPGGAAEVESHRQADLLAQAAGEILSAEPWVDPTGMLTDSDYATLERYGIREPRRFSTKGELMMAAGAGMAFAACDGNLGTDYRDDYAADISAFGFDEPEESAGDAVTLDEIVAGLPESLMRNLRKPPVSATPEFGTVVPPEEPGV